MISGVCGGLGEYLRIDPTFVRLFFTILVLSNGIGVLIYILLWIIMPREDARPASLGDTARASADEIAEHARIIGSDLRQAVHNPHPQTMLYIGVGLIFLGFMALLQNLPWRWLHWLDLSVFWPVLLILAGVVLLLRRSREG
jgi:phage shock protein C